MRMPAPLRAFLARMFTAMIRRRGSKMRVAGLPLLILTTIGAKSGKEREAILGWIADPSATDGSILVAGTNQGAAQQSAWLLNMAAHPDQVWSEIDGHRIHVRPETLEGEARAAAWASFKAHGNYGQYEVDTDREIPIVRLRPFSTTAPAS
jgi:deazaflavin-dependent oxidoreductase (nitroreductase family)